MPDPQHSSFRDPAGYVYRDESGLLYRTVNRSYEAEYEHLTQSGLYKSLVQKGWLVQHREVQHTTAAGYTLQPEEIPFISYPYEWSFSQLKDAALLTLDIQMEALKYGMSLKDASGYNIAFHLGKPVFIDTLSFEKYKPGQPWIAYRQFCQHFLAPLALAAYRSAALIKLLQNNIDGIALALASKLLPPKSYLSLGLLLHVHLHARAQKKLRKHPTSAKPAAAQQSILPLISNLRSTINSLTWQPDKTVWAAYYAENNNYTSSSMQHKEQLVDDFLASIKPTRVWDVGANTGRFSRIAAKHASQVIATDFDYSAVEILYRQIRSEGSQVILPLVSDVVNPSPGIGWFNKERTSFLERIQSDTILALAVVHHLAIANNLHLPMLAAFFAHKCRHLIVEFVPKNDSQVQLMLQGREDIFTGYTQAEFERAFASCFIIKEIKPIAETGRVLYLMQTNET